METVGEAVRFITNALKQLQGAAVLWQSQGQGAPGSVDLLKFLGKSNDWLLEKAEALKFLARARKLPPPSIDNDQIRQA